jgi:SAM-dependent methyltransferase
MLNNFVQRVATSLARHLPIVRRLPEPLKSTIRGWIFPVAGNSDQMDALLASENLEDYANRLNRELEIFGDQTEVNDLPPIFHYWSNTHLRPRFERFGFSNPDQFFAKVLEEAYREQTSRPVRFASVGCGNCDTEVRVAKLLLERGIFEFTIECLDINTTMLERGNHLAREAGVADQIKTTQVDFNLWNPAESTFEAIMANQSLHHVLGLERLFSCIDHALIPQGRFATSDMIGRNGHMRWPEAMEIIHEYWKELPPSYRWNIQLKRHEELLEYWDCSGEGFEGVRAQDILPLLIERFDFEFFLGFGNLIDPFIDRGFGPHFNANSAEDRQLIDRIEARDRKEIAAGTIKPTHMIATLRKRPYDGPLTIESPLSPEFCVRQG